MSNQAPQNAYSPPPYSPSPDASGHPSQQPYQQNPGQYGHNPDSQFSSHPPQNPDYIEHPQSGEETYESVGDGSTQAAYHKGQDPAQTGYNPAQPGYNPAQSGINSAQIGYYPAQTGYPGDPNGAAGGYNPSIQPQTTVYLQTVVIPLTNPPPNYLIQSILTFIFCCWAFGLVAILKSVASDHASKSGRREDAERESAHARRWNIIALVVGSFIWVCCIITFAVLIALD